MAGSPLSLSLPVLLLGGIIVLTIFVRAGMKRTGIPSLIGFMALGLVLRLLDSQINILSAEIYGTLDFLASIGVVVLLFRVGLESNLKGLLNQIRHASVIWAGNIVFSGLLGYSVASSLLGLELIPSLFIGVALTATSVGISISVWQETGSLKSSTGELLLDVAEMDDISGIIFMAVLISIVPILKGGFDSSLGGATGKTVGLILLKLAVFGVFCVLFSVYIEKHITEFFSRFKHSPDPMLMVAGFGFVIAAVAGLLGFSLAMGAFFAGLVFSRDPKAVKLDSSFGTLFDFFVPFFFVVIGLKVNPKSLTGALGLGGILLAVAVLGKLVGNGALSFVFISKESSALLAISMVPRAEIAMVIMENGKQLGDWAVSDQVFSAMVLVSLATCFLSPVFLRWLLKRWPQR